MRRSDRLQHPALTAERVRNLLSYSQVTGEFHWIKRKAKMAPGSLAGNWDKSTGYLVIEIDNKRYYAHRLAFLMVGGEMPKKIVDHKDGDHTNNRFANLRDAPRRVNQENRRRASRGNRSGFLGVYQPKKKYARWEARITVHGKRIDLGRFENPEFAHGAYLSAKRRLHEGCTI